LHKKAGYFLTSLVTISFSNNILHHGVSKFIQETRMLKSWLSGSEGSREKEEGKEREK
jgi:hypothetical protein